MGSIDNLTIIIPFFNGHKTLGDLLKSLKGAGVPVIIVDDFSDTRLTPGMAEQLAASLGLDFDITVLRPSQKGYFTGAVNYGINACSTDVLVLNQDTTLTGTQWLTLIAENRSKYALIGERIAGDHPAWPTGYVHGTFMFMRRDAIAQVGLMDEKHYPLWGATCDWQLRICRQGFEALPLVEIPGFHHRREGGFGESIKTILSRQPQLRSQLIQTPPLVSVIIPTHQHGRFLLDAINSLIGGETSRGYHTGQTFGGFEVIVVDDVSTDDTPQIMQQLANPWHGVKYIRLKSSKPGESSPHGTPVAQNTGISKAHGRFITILNADDMMAAERLATLIEAQLANPHSMIYDDAIRWGEHDDRVWQMKEYDFNRLLHENHVHAGIMFPKKAWEEVKGYPAQMKWGREDWAFNIALGVHGWCGVRVPKPMYLYRRHPQNRTKTNTTPEWHNRFLDQLRGMFPLIYAGDRPMACCGGKTNPVGAAPSAPQSLPGADGFTILEYVGYNDGTQSWWAASGQRYVAGGSKKYIQVANGDVASMLEQYDGATQVFKVYTPPQPVAEPVTAAVEGEQAEEPSPEPVVAMTLAPESDSPGELVEQVDVFAESSPIDTSQYPVKSKKGESIVGWFEQNQPDEATAQLVYNDEQMKQARTTALSFIENYIAGL